ncbi:MAG: hypothetical protein MUC83_03665 [Pirellula sp.]|jgi:hypothetical protein|nr:hypothetical protein [Pirellula sp.]
MNQRLADAGLLHLPPSADHGDDTLGQVVVNWFGTPIHVHVIFNLGKSSEPNALQVEAFRSFMECRDIFFVELEQELFEYYNRVSSEFTIDGETRNELFPKVRSARELGKMIQLTGILVDYHDGDDWSAVIGLLAECSWEQEHGLGVKVVHRRVVEIGFQDLVI